MKQIKISLKPNENKTFNMKLIKDGSLFREEEVTKDELSDCINDFQEPGDVIKLRKYVGLFKVKSITYNLK